MATFKDKRRLDNLYESDRRPFEVWQQRPDGSQDAVCDAATWSLETEVT
jgi:hypothetical protein